MDNNTRDAFSTLQEQDVRTILPPWLYTKFEPQYMYQRFQNTLFEFEDSPNREKETNFNTCSGRIIATSTPKKTQDTPHWTVQSIQDS